MSSAGGVRTCLLVLGVHRSGTSALTRVLSILGAALPKRLMGGGEGNESGHWEGARIVQYHDQLMAEYGSDWMDWRELDMTRLPVSRRVQMKADIRRIVDEDFGDQPLIVIKDPRICRFAGFFIECLQDSGYRVVPVIANRNPLEVIDSLQTREIYWPSHLRRTDAALLWLSHQLGVEEATRGLSRVFVNYDALLTGWQAVADRVERDGQLRFPFRPVEVSHDVDAFLDPGRRSMARTASDVHLEPDLHGWVSDTYEALLRLEAGGDTAALRQTLDRVRREFRDTAPILSELAAERRRLHDETVTIRQDADTLRLETQRLSAEVADRAASVAALLGEKSEADARFGQTRDALDALREDLAARQAEIAGFLAENDALKSSIEQLSDANRQLEARFAQGTAELADSQAESLRIQTLLAEAQVQMEALRQLQSDAEARELARLAEIDALAGQLVQARNTHDIVEQAMVDQARAEAVVQLAELQRLQALADELERQKAAISQLLEARVQQMDALAGQMAKAQADLLETGRRLAESEGAVAAAEARLTDTDKARLEAEDRVWALNGHIDTLRHEYNEALRVAGEKSKQIDGLSQQVSDARRTASRLQSGAQQIVGLLNDARSDAYRTHVSYRNSTSWRVSAPLRWVSSLVRGRGAAPVAPTPMRYEDHFGPTYTLPTIKAADGVPVPGNEIVFFTICSRNFMAFARTLFKSLARFYPRARLVVALCDAKDDYPPFVAANEPYDILYLDDLDIPDWRDMSQRYNVTEFNTAIKPFVFLHLFEKKNASFVVYFDPDIYVVDHLTEIEEAFGNGADVILTPHMLEPNERAEMNERRLLQYGIYNLGFVGIARTAKALDVVRWWGRKLERECIIKRDEGLFVDQKWADHFPAFFARPHVLHHPGYNIAYWNLSNRTVSWADDRWTVNGMPVRFLHFSGNNLDDPKILSRHSGEHRADTIGEMKALLDEYRDAVFANGHAEFRKIPYAFSWSGASGFNEHTPKPAHEDAAGAPALAPAVVKEAAVPARTASGADIFRTAMDIVGGPGKLLSRTARVIVRGDLSSLKRGIQLARTAAEGRRKVVARAEAQTQSPDALVDWQPYRKSMLVIEWKTPRPDADSGSRTVFYTIEILTLLGYRVTFLPINLMEDGSYSRALTDLGVRCIDASDYASVREYFEAEGNSFDFIMLNRVSVVAAHMDQIKALCPQAKLIFNTVDLHYVREMRDAEMNGQSTALALQTKALELGIVRDSDLTIVLSHVEEEILRAEAPDAKIAVLPLVFSEIDADPPGFDARSDILFIGSFPHKPNVDAVIYFADQIFPALRERIPGLRWHIVGSEPTAEVLNLASRPGIIVHGYVADLAPLFRSVRLTVAPLRYGAGIKGKIATSLSFGVPCICTPIAAEGMRVHDGNHVIIADTVEEWCQAVVSAYADRDRWTDISAKARQIAVDEFSLAANTHRIGAMMQGLDASASDMAFLRFSSLEEFNTYWADKPEILAARDTVEKAMLPADEAAFDTTGFCAVCGETSKFTTSYMYSAGHYSTGEKSPNWREHVACWGCGFTMRLRAAMQLFLSRIYQGAGSSVYLNEQTTPLFRWMQSIHPTLGGSEYLGDACAFGQVKDGLRNEDLTHMTYADASFDAMLSFDVLEHVTDDVQAFRECYRCLRPGGTLMFTAPFAYNKPDKVVRARMLPDGQVEHILPPEYHGNPVDPDGALCFRYFAWDVVKDLKSAGFVTVEVMNYWSRDFAYLGDFGFIIIARKGR